MATKTPVRKVVLAYLRAGLDTSIILKWLQQTHGCEVVTFTADLGQGEELGPAREKAVLLGVKPQNIFTPDLRERFVGEFVFPMFRANALYEGQYLLGTAIARPLIAQGQIDLARQVGADAVCHGATGKGNDQVRFELAYYALAPDITVIAPWREWEFKSREALDRLRPPGAPDPDPAATSFRRGPVQRRRQSPALLFRGKGAGGPRRRSVFSSSSTCGDDVAAGRARTRPVELRIDFVAHPATPVAVDGEALAGGAAPHPARMNWAAPAASAAFDLVENRLVGMKSRGVYENLRRDTILHAAHRGIESITLDGGAMHLKDELDAEVCGADLPRPVVFARAGDAAGGDRRLAEGRHRRGAA